MYVSNTKYFRILSNYVDTLDFKPPSYCEIETTEITAPIILLLLASIDFDTKNLPWCKT